jgi:hypothetical protein
VLGRERGLDFARLSSSASGSAESMVLEVLLVGGCFFWREGVLVGGGAAMPSSWARSSSSVRAFLWAIIRCWLEVCKVWAGRLEVLSFGSYDGIGRAVAGRPSSLGLLSFARCSC